MRVYSNHFSVWHWVGQKFCLGFSIRCYGKNLNELFGQSVSTPRNTWWFIHSVHKMGTLMLQPQEKDKKVTNHHSVICWYKKKWVKEKQYLCFWLLLLKSFIDTEIQFSCAKNHHLYTVTYLCWDFFDRLLLFFSLSGLSDFVTPWTAACQASLSSIAQSLRKFMSIFCLLNSYLCSLPSKGGPREVSEVPRTISEVCNRGGPGKFVLEEGH